MPLNAYDRTRYNRQMILEEWGEEGQARLKSACVFIAGTGGLGSPAAIYLAAAGVGTLRVCDGDVVELSNLNRQILHSDERVGDRKAESASRTLSAARAMVVAGAELVAQVEGEEMFLGDDAVALSLPAQAQFDQKRGQQLARHQSDRIQRQRLVVDLFQPLLVEGNDRRQHAVQVVPPMVGVRPALYRGRRLAGQHFRPDLADAHALLGERRDAIDLVDVAAGIEPVAAVLAHRLDQPVAALPGAQRDGADTGEFRHGADGVQLLTGVVGGLCAAVHGVALQGASPGIARLSVLKLYVNYT